LAGESCLQTVQPLRWNFPGVIRRKPREIGADVATLSAAEFSAARCNAARAAENLLFLPRIREFLAMFARLTFIDVKSTCSSFSRNTDAASMAPTLTKGELREIAARVPVCSGVSSGGIGFHAGPKLGRREHYGSRKR
jgi:hypothetical protein